MKYYFAYGANMSLESMALRCPDAEPVGRAFLQDWELKMSSHATIQPANGKRVPGALWKITENCERNLDAFEGWPVYYRKETVAIGDREVMVYVMNDPDYSRKPGIYYVELLEDGYRDWKLPEAELKASLIPEYV